LAAGEFSLQYDEEDNQPMNVQVPEGRQPEVINKKVIFLCFGTTWKNKLSTDTVRKAIITLTV